MNSAHWAEQFYQNFVFALSDAGFDAAQISAFAWKPYAPQQLQITGVDRSHDLSAISLSAADVAQTLSAGQRPTPFAADAVYKQKRVLILVPGFTHETLKNLSWHEQMQRKDSPHHVVMLRPGAHGAPPQEEVMAQGDGLKLLYVRYPRSNADSAHIVPAIADMLRDCVSLNKWIADGYKLFFVGYSYGAPLALELLAALNAKEHHAPGILENTIGFLGLCGDIGGSYLADDVLGDKSALVSIKKFIAFCSRHKWAAKLAGLGTPQLLADMLGGVTALGHAQRQAQIQQYAPKLPAHIAYFSIGAVLPLSDYRRKPWHFNLDDWSMHAQAVISDPISVYNDGQVVLSDNLVPDAPQIPQNRNIHLGAVRTHHWGVSYKTFNQGNNNFPRPLFYKALMQTIAQCLEAEGQETQ